MPGSGVVLNNSSIANGGEALQHKPTRDLLNWVVMELQNIRKSLGAASGGAGAGLLVGNVTADVASIAAGAEATQAVTVTGVAVGDMVIGVSIVDTPASGSLADAVVMGRVSATNTVTITITNVHAATALDLSAAAVFRVAVLPSAAASLAAMTLALGVQTTPPATG